MVELLPGRRRGRAVGGIAGDVTSGARARRLHRGRRRRLDVIQTVAANWDRQEALTQATTVLRAHPDLAGFFVANDDMALGVARAVADVGRKPAR